MSQEREQRQEMLFGSPPEAVERPRSRDLSFEALASSTGTDWETGRGELNKALALIRDQMAGVDDDHLANEITFRARLYRNVMPSVLLTPTALAKHWRRVFEITRPATKRNEGPCGICDDHHLIVAAVREDGSEEMAPCPECGPKLVLPAK